MASIGERFFRALRTVNLATFRFWREPSTLIDFLRKVDMLFLSYSCAPIQTLDLPKLLGSGFSAQVFVPFENIKPGSTPFVDLVALAALVKKKRPKRVFEIGTFEGLTAILFATNSDPGAKVYTLDLPPQSQDISRTYRSYEAHSIGVPYQTGYLIDSMGLGSQVERLIGDSALFDFDPYKNIVDLFFVDGAHTKDYVARDSLNAFQCITPNGWVVWHDCFTPQVLSVLRQIARHWPVYHIRETNLAVVFQKPGADFPWQMLHREIR